MLSLYLGLLALAGGVVMLQHPLPRRLGTTAIVSSGVCSSKKPKPGALAGKSRYQAAPYAFGPTKAITPASPGRPQFWTYR